ncbi:polysaccharide pyruvyl transferase family protein [Myroides odoratimimus]|uniref:polysaccharide pyruvyl transferase family protein n=1 Tax=Myroides odoratimimus TaxID=76832 RepID=UPI002576C141|nr:polysaccharide pyruvyl transferase family protein [Myroides odoratimimus]MDM1450400.1 polysaccharide pyruvyl transferase family protein [Myroides odoratimimus]
MNSEKRKVGILTMPIKENYGGIIQAAALYFFLKEKNFEPYIIMKKYDESKVKRALRYLLSHNLFYKLYDYKALTQREKQNLFLEEFISDFFSNVTQVSYDKEEYLDSIKGLEAIIVGSDQVWRYNYIGSNYPYYFLDYLPSNITKIAYAASFGTGKWEGDSASILHIRQLLKTFKGISVRENSGIDLCLRTFEFDKALHVLDPTFLPNVDFYNDLIDVKKITKKVGFFSYVLDKSGYIDEILSFIEEEIGATRCVIELTNYGCDVKPSIEEWLYHFREADFIVTDSFHGMVFSIIFNKQFVCVGNSSRGLDRFYSLLELLNLEDRLVSTFNVKVIRELLDNKIDYIDVNEKLSELKDLSKSFLLQNLNN